MICQRLGVKIESLTPNLVGSTLEFEQREFPWWTQGLLKMLPADMDNVIIVRRDQEVIGSLLSFTPSSRFLSGGMQHNQQIDGKLGAIGAVGIAEAWRGKGLGLAMCEAALAHIRSCGGTHCYIDQVEPEVTPFYEKIGATTYAEYRCGSKCL